MKLRSFLVFAVPILVLSAVLAVSLATNLVYDFAIVGALAVVPLLFTLDWSNSNRRDMLENKHGWPSISRGQKTSDSKKAQRKFASTAGGHVASLVGHLRRLVGHGIGGRPRLMLGH